MSPTQKTIIAGSSVLAVTLALLAPGCASGPQPPTRGTVIPWNLKITKNTPASIELDLIGVSKSEDDYWRNNVKMDEYWKPGSPIRQAVIDGKRSVSATFDQSKTFYLDRTNAIWKTWFSYGSYELAIMANLPGKYAPGPSDPRRLFLLLGKNEWDAKKRTLEVEILEGQIRVLTPQKP